MSYRGLIEEYIEHAKVAEDMANRSEVPDQKESWLKIALGYREMAHLRQRSEATGRTSGPPR